MKKICVIGSLNIDFVATVWNFPKPGETITGKEFGYFFGGKGANQAVAAGRLHSDVMMVGKVGNDIYGTQYVDVLQNNGVKTIAISREHGISSGIALIVVDNVGENNIIIIPGANEKVDKEFIDEKFNLFSDRDILMLQMEIPCETVLHTIERLEGKGKTVILDPAPAGKFPDNLYRYVDIITPNETELEILTGLKVNDEKDLRKAANILLENGVKTVVAKAGKNGAYIIEAKHFEHVPGFKVEVVDTTAAGDSFNAGLAVALSLGKELKESVQFANAVGALSTTGKGAQGAMKNLEEVKAFLKCNGIEF